MKKVILVISLGWILGSCNENRVFEEHIDPSGNLEWNRKEVIKFDIEIIDTSIKYTMILALRHATGFRFGKMNVQVSETDPDGNTSLSDFVFLTMDEKGYTGEVSGDIYDLESMWREDHSFSRQGIYHYEIRQTMPDDKIHMVMEVGMIVDKVVSRP